MVDYGLDLDCDQDFTPEFRTCSGLKMIGQAICRRYRTPRGMLLDDKNYGTDLTEYLNSDVDDSVLVQIKSDMAAEPVKDERIQLVVIQSIAYTQGTKLEDGSINATLAVTLAAGPTFTMTIAVSSVTVTILNITPT